MNNSLSVLTSVADDLRMSYSARLRNWARNDLAWLMASTIGHTLMLLIALIVLRNFAVRKTEDAPPVEFDAATESPTNPAEDLVHISPKPLECPLPPDLEPAPPKSDLTSLAESVSTTTDPATNEPPGNPNGEKDIPDFNLGRFGAVNGKSEITLPGKGPGPRVERHGTPNGTGVTTGCPSIGNRNIPLRPDGNNKPGDRAIARALLWIAKHQAPDGRWSFGEFEHRCTDKSCTGRGEAVTDAGATGISILPFLAAGCTSDKNNPYRKQVADGIRWLMYHQNPKTGDLAEGSKGNSHMYAHAIATIALCEAYAMSPSQKDIGRAAQAAVNFIVASQNAGTGGWRYEPGQEGDTSVVGWQVMALKSAQMAYLSVPTQTMEGAEKWLKACSSGNYGEQFAYTPNSGATPTMSSVGLLCSQYLHLRRDDPQVQSGLDYLTKHPPKLGERDTYYWYYATQVMHNVPGPQWDEWHRSVRRILIESQIREGCAQGSWDPAKPTPDRWGAAGGRLMVTCLSCLTLEVTYRFLPLFAAEQGPGPRT